MSYWQGLIASGGVNNQPQWTAAWNKGMNDGQYIAWVSDVWAPSDFPTDAPAGAGKWAMTELPQWTAGANVVGNWGGSSTAVMAASKHQQDAAEFVAWLNTSAAGTAALVSQGGIYPADSAAEAAIGSAPSYFSNQPNFWSLAKDYASQAAERHLGPGRERRLLRVHYGVRQRCDQQELIPVPAVVGAVGRGQRHEEERLHGGGRLT